MTWEEIAEERLREIKRLRKIIREMERELAKENEKGVQP